MENIVAYILLCLVLVISPGPNTFLIFSTASHVGKHDALLKIFGLVTATYIHGLLSLFGVSLILLKSPLLFNAIKILGALYLCYLGLKFLWQAWRNENKKSNTDNQVIKLTHIKSFMAGFITQILNPKVSIFYIAAFPQFINFHSSSHYINGLALISIHALTIATWFTVMTLCINQFSRPDKDSRWARVMLAISGILLIYFSVLLGLQPLLKVT
ncbi:MULTISPECIES: LysE family translocator [unclassified Acinetobacter]|uniref:LysE family translocator n=1 Tax=unclassified Acinetobacter TaxID=196816 RepID=UPI0035B7CBB1